MLESYTQRGENWQDFICVFLKDENLASRFPNRILDIKTDYENGQLLGKEGILNLSLTCQNDRKLEAIGQVVSEQIVIT